MGRKLNNLSGKIVNNIKILSIVEDESTKKSGVHKKYNCQCLLCNKIFIVSQQHLSGEKSIKTCAECRYKQKENLTNKQFGYLTVIDIDNSQHGRTKFLCRCQCGNYTTVAANHLKEGSITSCGCIISKSEEIIKKWLKNNNIYFETQKKFSDLKFKKPLRFDFYFPDKKIALEYNGIQHYKPVPFFGRKEHFYYTQHLDELKKEYCKNNNITLITIQYSEDIISKLIEIFKEEIV